MSLKLNVILQTLGVIAQGVNGALDLLPAPVKWPAALVIGALQGTIGFRAHYWNPDGTRAETPWRK